MPTIRERGGRFQAQVRIKSDGRLVHEESATFDTRRQAETWGLLLERKIKEEAPRSGYVGTTTFGDVVRKHAKLLLDLAEPGARNGSDASVKALLAAPFAAKPINKVTTADITRWAMDHRSGRSPATILHRMMTLRSAYRTASTMHDIPANLDVVINATTQLMRMGVASKSIERDRRVSDGEIDQICSHHEKLNGTTIPLRIALNLAITLPRRRSELFGGMKWADYDGETVKLWDTKDPTKVRNEVIPIPPKARKIIDGLPRSKTGFIMPHNAASVGAAVYKACRMLEIEDLHLHDLRHEGVSRLFEEGLDIPRVAMISGHQSWQTLRRYTHLKPKDVIARLEEFAAR